MKYKHPIMLSALQHYSYCPRQHEQKGSVPFGVFYYATAVLSNYCCLKGTDPFCSFVYGSMNPQLAVRTGFSDEDAETIKQILPKMLENDTSSARPDGSMEVLKVIWWQHNSKGGQYSSSKVHNTLRDTIKADGSFELATLEGLEPEFIDGF